MPIEYLIQELTGGKLILRSSKFTANEAAREAIRLHKKTGNPVNVSQYWVPYNQIEEMEDINEYLILAAKIH